MSGPLQIRVGQDSDFTAGMPGGSPGNYVGNSAGAITLPQSWQDQLVSSQIVPGIPNDVYTSLQDASAFAKSNFDKSFGDAQLVSDILSGYSADAGASTQGGMLGSSAGAVHDQWSYLSAPYAEHYGMDKDTAYSESLSNTAYQRAVNDMLQAGLNPSLLFSSGTAASTVSGSSGSSGSYDDDTNLGALFGSIIGQKLGGYSASKIGAEIGEQVWPELVQMVKSLF